MAIVLKYRGRVVNDSDVAFIQSLIQEHPAASRRQLSEKLCAAWSWVQSNGTPCDMVCRGLMLALDRGGHIQLPPVKSTPHNPFIARQRPDVPDIDASVVEGCLKDLGPLEFRLVRRTPDEALFNGLIEHHHYLSYTQPVGEQLKYMVYALGRPIACLAWSSAARHLGPRDRFIGRVPHLASHILGRMAAMVPRDWERIYGHPVYYLETFIDPERWRGTCYRAANWMVLGLTTGRGKAANGHRPNRSLKQVLAYPLYKDFRRRLMEPA